MSFKLYSSALPSITFAFSHSAIKTARSLVLLFIICVLILWFVDFLTANITSLTKFPIPRSLISDLSLFSRKYPSALTVPPLDS